MNVHGSLFTLLLLTACDGVVPPLRGRIEVGEEPYVVFVGGRTGNRGDLYAVSGDGGPVVPITFTNIAELAPALSPDGAALAFLRARSLRDSTPATLWVMNLRTGGERELPLPEGAGSPRRVGWSPDGGSLYVAAAGGLYRVRAPPQEPAPRPVSSAERPAAESSLAVLVGDPIFARVVPCQGARDLCVVGDTGSPGLLARAAHDAVRWGPDSVGYFAGDLLEVRPLGPGRVRRLRWSDAPRRPREPTYFRGRGR